MVRTSIKRNIKIGNLSALPIQRIGDNAQLRIEEAKHGGKIILPPSALRTISRVEHSVMIFKLVLF